MRKLFSFLLFILLSIHSIAANSAAGDIVRRAGGTWALVSMPYSSYSDYTNNSIVTGYLRLSTDPNFITDVVTTDKRPISPPPYNNISHSFINLKPKTTYYLQGAIVNSAGDSYFSTTEFTTQDLSFDVSMNFDFVTSTLSWDTIEAGVPDTTTHATGYVNWGHSYQLGHTTNKVDIPPTHFPWLDLKFQQQDSAVKPGDTIYYQYVVISNDAAQTEFKGDIRSSTVPAYYAPDDPKKPCNINDNDGAVHVVSENVAIVCSNMINYPGVMKDEGANGQLNCPQEFPINLNYSPGITVTIPKIGIPVTLGAAVSFWRSSSEVRLWAIVHAWNKGIQGSATQPGWQKWSAANWSLSAQQAQYWIYCGKLIPPPGGGDYNMGGAAN
jgi:hypothetical protein